MNNYDHKKIEDKWQKIWEETKPNKATEDKNKKKFYSLIEFPYPSGNGLHVGHIRSNTAMDIISRKRRAEGYNVLYPIGWDAFGLPTENYAIKTGISPKIVTKQNTDTFRRQLKSLGFSFDWDREINTTDPKYYKWTQWIFLKMLEAGLAYKKKMTINWCPKDLIGLANEEVVNGCCERCGTKVEKREKEQWMLAITKYAERLDKDLDDTEFLEKIKIQQRNWIGKSEGAEISFNILNSDKNIKVFTTRPDTIFGVTYLVLSPENKILNEFGDKIKNLDEVKKYIQEVKSKTEIERTDSKSEKTGIELKGIKAINPANNKEIPIWIADYVLSEYGTGAVMAVPAHDERDWDFAKKYSLEIINVVAPHYIDISDECKIRDNAKTVDRKVAISIVKHWSEDKYICLDWKVNKWKTFVTGGIEEGESPEMGGIREIQEETGYKNIKFIKQLGEKYFSSFYAPHKDRNQNIEGYGLYYELQNGDKDEINADENSKHEIKWIPKEEVLNFIKSAPLNGGDQRYLYLFWNRLITGNYCYFGEGKIINSDKFDGKNSEEIKKEITSFVNGKWVTNFKLRDWIFSRQRYWGEPIPVVHCDRCGIVPIPEKELPLELPEVPNYKPTDNGESPLSSIPDWVNTKCPKCGGDAKRETDTMPNWAGSSWYYLRYMDAHNDERIFSEESIKYWNQVDWYNGGMEHTTLHLLYSRFWHKFLYDIKLVPTSEPYKKRTSHGLILAGSGEKMSKSKGNVVNPDEIIEKVGADTLRVHEMFMGPFDQPIAWDSNAIAGSRRFLERVWKLKEKINSDSENSFNELLNKTIKKVGDDIEEMKFNTAISSLMIMLNEFEKQKNISKENYEIFIKLLSPFAPHITEELWEVLGNTNSIHEIKWPDFSENVNKTDKVKMVIQINGKVRGTMETVPDLNDKEVENMAINKPEIQKWISGQEIKKVIVIKNKVINIVL